jgi:hypothetical protein
VPTMRMNLWGAAQLASTFVGLGDRCHNHRSQVAHLLDGADALLGTFSTVPILASILESATFLGEVGVELLARLSTYEQHPFGDALMSSNVPLKELAALDDLATAPLEEFLASRVTAERSHSPFDWSASGLGPWGACNGPVPSVAITACLRHDFIYRNWRRLRDRYNIADDAGSGLKNWADNQLGDATADAVERNGGSPIELLSVGPVGLWVWKELVEPVVKTFGVSSWNAEYQAPAPGRYYGDIAPDNRQTRHGNQWRS